MTRQVKTAGWLVAIVTGGLLVLSADHPAGSTPAPVGHARDAVRKDFNARFFNEAQHRYDKGSQTALAMPLVVGLAPEGEREHVLEALVSDIRAHNNHVTAGDIGFHYVVDALLDGGRSDVLYGMMERADAPSYGYQLSQGATALTELKTASPTALRIDGREPDKATGVISSQSKEHKIEIVLGSGHYLVTNPEG